MWVAYPFKFTAKDQFVSLHYNTLPYICAYIHVYNIPQHTIYMLAHIIRLLILLQTRHTQPGGKSPVTHANTAVHSPVVNPYLAPSPPHGNLSLLSPPVLAIKC